MNFESPELKELILKHIQEIREQTAQDILEAIHDPKVNFIEYIEGIIGGD